MAEKIVMIALSPTMDDGKIIAWEVKEGDDVLVGQVICEVETDKSTMEYESLNEGNVLKILTPEGCSAKIGEPIAIFGKKGEDISNLLNVEFQKADAVATSEQEQKVQIPTVAPSSPAPSTVTKNSIVTYPPVTSSRKIVVPPVDAGLIKATPLARNLAKDLEIDLSLIQGTGANGRVQRADVEYFASTGKNLVSGTNKVVHTDQNRISQTVSPSAVSQYDVALPVKGVRSVIAKKLSESKFSSPHFYVKNSMKTNALVSMRTKVNAMLNQKVSLNAFIIKLVASAIRKNPAINASWQEITGQEATITYHSNIDIALAVDLGNGLITPVIRDCQYKNVELIDGELQELIQKVRQQSIMPEEYTNATFTISNLGSFGVEEFTAIINPPAACILAVGMSQKVPVVNDSGQIEVQSKMQCTLSSDHRLIDGSFAAVFMKDLREIIENPALALYF